MAGRGAAMPLSDMPEMQEPEGELDPLTLMARQLAEALQVVSDEDLARQIAAAIVRSSDDAIVGRTLDGTIVSWNSGAERLYGYSAEDILGRPTSVLVPPDRADEPPMILEKMLAGERIDRYETVRMRKDSSLVQVSV